MRLTDLLSPDKEPSRLAAALITAVVALTGVIVEIADYVEHGGWMAAVGVATAVAHHLTTRPRVWSQDSHQAAVTAAAKEALAQRPVIEVQRTTHRPPL